jgi:RND family efflux transporter MFP subunit
MKYPSIIVATLLAAWSGCGFAAQSDTPSPSVLVTVTALREGSLARTITAYGAVLSAPSARRTITASTSATVSAVYAHAGDDIAAGAPLLRLVPTPQTTAAYTQARSAQRMAEKRVARTREMFAQHLATAQQLADAQKTASDARSALDVLEAQGANGPTTVRAPFRAIVMSLPAAPGERVAPGAPLADLARPESLTLRVGVTPAEARSIDAGNPARVTALGGSKSLSGTVSRRGAVIDPATGLIPVDISLPADALFPGEAAEAEITVGQTHGYVVPHTAILVDPRGAPYVVQANGKKARKVAVSVVGTHGDEDAIRGPGLNAGQPLILAGNYQLDDGMDIRLAAEHQGAGK